MPDRKIYLLVPTRPVPTHDKLPGLRRLVESVQNTADSKNVQLCFGVDERPEDRAHLEFCQSVPGAFIRHETDTCSGHWKHLSLRCPERPDDVLMLCADDVWFPFQGWDEKVLQHAAKPRHELYFCDDGFGWRSTFATHPFLRFDTAQRIGGLATGLWSRANDTWLWCLWHLFDPSRVIYMQDVKIKHQYVRENTHQVNGHRADMATFRERGADEMTWRVKALREAAGITTPPVDGFCRDYMKFTRSGDRYEIEILGNR